MQKYDDFQKVVIADIPAVFLYSPHYLYGISKSIHGFDAQLLSTPSDRFSGIRDWYIDTARQLK
jgi:peptide/nickel transport system substrate-binding protein